MNRRVVDLWAPAIGASGTVLAYGHWGAPVLVFPSEAGRAGDFESNGMVDAVADLVEQGRVKLYCVDSHDAQSWSDRGLPLEERARRHGEYEGWILDQVVPWIHEDCGGPLPAETNFCPACGHSVAADEFAPPAEDLDQTLIRRWSSGEED